MEKATINLGLTAESLGVHTFILPGPLKLPGPGTMYVSYALHMEIKLFCYDLSSCTCLAVELQL